jgi:CheY-like chemotaxis protein
MKKIMIFDDDEDILSICAFILEEDGWNVAAYPDCNVLIERVSSFAPEVILMDNWIPDEGGIKATRMIKENLELAATRIIYFSANSDISPLAEAAGADRYLAKPFDLEILRTIVMEEYVNYLAGTP